MSLSSLLQLSNPLQTLHQLDEQCRLMMERKYLLAAVFYPEFAQIMERAMENKARPCLLCCDLRAFELFRPPQPARLSSDKVTQYAATEGGAFFHLLFRIASFPPPFRIAVRLLPELIQRMLQQRGGNGQPLPPWYRQKVQGVRGGITGGPIIGQQRSTNIEYLDVSLYEYFFLSCVHFLLQPDIHVQTPPPVPNARTKPPPPPTPDQTTEAFRVLLDNFLCFFLPVHGVWSSSLKLEENGWSLPIIKQRGVEMLETFIETIFGQYSYAAASPLTAASNAIGTTAAGQYPSLNYPGSPFYQAGRSITASYIPPDEAAIPSRKMISAIQTIIYHWLDFAYVRSPEGQALASITAIRASMIQYQQEKYDKHADCIMIKLKLDWHFFGLMQHVFARWPPEWCTSLGIHQIPSIPMGGSTQQTNYLPTSSRLDDRFTRLLELWMDYLEPWKSVYSEDFNPQLWRWWIVVNLPFYTILLRDFLRVVLNMDLGRDNSSARVLHLKTMIHIFAIFDGPVLEQIQEIETMIFKNPSTAPTTTHRTEGNANQQNSLLQQETALVRHSLFHLADLRPENYVPVFPPAAAYLHQLTNTKSTHGLAGLHSPVSALPQRSYTTPLPMSPRGGEHFSPIRMTSPTPLSQPPTAPRLETQTLSHELINLLSLGYSYPDEVSSKREAEVLNAPSFPPPLEKGQTIPTPLKPSLRDQQELCGQLIEKHLRHIFGLPAETRKRSEDEQAGGPTGRNNETEYYEHKVDSIPKKFEQLEPEYDSIASRESHLPARLTAAGRAQIKMGLKLCSKHDVPVLGPEEELPICSYEFEFGVRWTRQASEWLHRRTGRKVDLRFMASQNFWKYLFITLVFLYLLIWTLTSIDFSFDDDSFGSPNRAAGHPSIRHPQYGQRPGQGYAYPPPPQP